MLMLFAIAVVLSFDESVQAPIPGGEELHSLDPGHKG